jgi:hypothetical protein
MHIVLKTQDFDFRKAIPSNELLAITLLYIINYLGLLYKFGLQN